MRRRLIETEEHKRRSNLMFFSLPDEEGNSCVEELSSFMKEQLHLDTPCKLLNTKRVGRLKVNGTLPIVTTFVIPMERQKVWERRFLLANPFGMSEDFPPAIRKARRSLVPQVKELKRQGRRAGTVFQAILMCNDQVVNIIDIAEVVV